MYDVDENGMIDLNEMTRLVKSIFKVSQSKVIKLLLIVIWPKITTVKTWPFWERPFNTGFFKIDFYNQSIIEVYIIAL